MSSCCYAVGNALSQIRTHGRGGDAVEKIALFPPPSIRRLLIRIQFFHIGIRIDQFIHTGFADVTHSSLYRNHLCVKKVTFRFSTNGNIVAAVQQVIQLSTIVGGHKVHLLIDFTKGADREMVYVHYVSFKVSGKPPVPY